MRKLASLTLFTVLAMAVACGGTKKEIAEPDQDPVEFEDMPKGEGDPTPVATEAFLKVSAVTLTIQGTVLTIGDDGKITVAGNHIGTVTEKGEFLAPNEGLYATLKPDGSMVGAHIKLDRFAGIHVSDTGVLKKKSDESGEMVDLNQISETGEVSENGVVGLTIEGPAEGRRAAMFVYLVVAASAPAQEPAPTPTPTPTPTTEPAAAPEAPKETP